MKGSRPTLKSLRVGLLQFPGSNCDVDCANALRFEFEIEPQIIWHTTQKLPKLDAVFIPGGFSFGDYLRSGALASHSPVMKDVKEFAANEGAIFGICNGFQILVESAILPGMLLHNESLQFICKEVMIKNNQGIISSLPIAHGEGRYFADPATIKKLYANNQIAFKYCDADGAETPSANPNGALENIAGIYSENKRVVGMMPHPERAMSRYIGGSNDGVGILRDFLERI